MNTVKKFAFGLLSFALLAMSAPSWAAYASNDVDGIPLPIPVDARTPQTGEYGILSSPRVTEVKAVEVRRDLPTRITQSAVVVDRGLTSGKTTPPVQAVYITSNKSESQVMSEIRDGLTTNRALSQKARNVRISYQDGRVTVRGLVNDDFERAVVSSIASNAVGSANVIDQMYTNP